MLEETNKSQIAETHFAQALLCENRKDFFEAEKNFKSGLVIDGANLQARYDLASLYDKHLNEPNKALEQYQMCVEIDPLHEDGLYALGCTYLLDFSNYKKAKEYFQRLVELRPDHAMAYFYLGVIENDADIQLSLYEKSYKLNPNNAELCNNLALLLCSEFTDISRADYLYQQCLLIKPDYSIGMLNYAEFLTLSLGKHEEALQLCARSLQINPRFAMAHFTYSVLLRKHLKSYKRAKEHYLIATKLNQKLIIPTSEKLYNIFR